MMAAAHKSDESERQYPSIMDAMHPRRFYGSSVYPCPVCGGSGWHLQPGAPDDSPCPACNGEGSMAGWDLETWWAGPGERRRLHV